MVLTYIISMLLVWLFCALNRVYYRELMVFLAMVPFVNTVLAVVHMFHLLKDYMKP